MAFWFASVHTKQSSTNKQTNIITTNKQCSVKRVKIKTKSKKRSTSSIFTKNTTYVRLVINERILQLAKEFILKQLCIGCFFFYHCNLQLVRLVWKLVGDFDWSWLFGFVCVYYWPRSIRNQKLNCLNKNYLWVTGNNHVVWTFAASDKIAAQHFYCCCCCCFFCLFVWVCSRVHSLNSNQSTG